MTPLECACVLTHCHTRRYNVVIFLALIHIIYLPLAEAFPPYKSTDADTADPYNLELRVGLIQMEREDGSTDFVSPLLRANFGFPRKFEIVSEFEYVPEDDELGEGAAGFKWAPLQGRLSFGIETLMLLPVRSGDNGVGVESQLVATLLGDNHSLQVHVNAGGFHDPRGLATENGWRASILTELTESSFRPGLELFAKQKNGQDADVRLGMGIIKGIGRFEIRSAAHIGLSSETPDVVFNIWLSMKIPF